MVDFNTFPGLEKTYDDPAAAEDIGNLVLGEEVARQIGAGADALAAIQGLDQLLTPEARINANPISVEDKSSEAEQINVGTGSGPHET
jgi:hypothetical protein